MFKQIISVLALALIISGCNNKSFEINGTLEGAIEGTMIYIDKLGSVNLVPFDSVEIDENNKFMFRGDISMPTLFLLRTGNNNFLTTLLEPGEKMVLTAKSDSLSFPTKIKGSPNTRLMIDYNLKLQETISDLGKLNLIYEEHINDPDLALIMEDLDKQAQEIIGGINSYTKEYIDANLTSMVSMIALYQQVVPGVYVINPEEDLDYFIRVDSTLFSLYPESEPVKYFHEQISQLIVSMETRNTDNAVFEEGGEAPDFTLPDRDGTPVSLSSTRGKIVLLDFWAAWCPPCRTENPNLVNAYEKFNEKGFDIFQVSLDQTREAWLKGIEEDNLGQWHHVSDLKYWESMVVPLYRIQGIPTSFLLDRDGKIIGSNLRGSALVSKLEEIFE